MNKQSPTKRPACCARRADSMIKRSYRPLSRPGFTLIELLVSIAIIAILVSLIVPAVQSAREAARRTQCKNNLHQLGLAFTNFHDNSGYNALPPSDLADGWATWAVLTLPYLEEGNAYDHWDLDQEYYVQPPEAGRVFPQLICPSRTPSDSADQGDIFFYLPPTGLVFGPNGNTDYATVEGTQPGFWNGPIIRAIDDNTNAMSTLFPQLFGFPQTYDSWRPQRSFQQLTDGTSYTAMIGEKHRFPGAFDSSAYNGDIGSGYSRVLGSVFPIVELNFSSAGWSRRFGSPHAGICHFALADGSARSISVSIDGDVLERLANINDDQPIGEF